MEVIRVDAEHPDAASVERAAVVLRRGGLVAFPTETVYGLGGNALDTEAVARIFRAKGRPTYNPLIVHVADSKAARALVTRWPDAAGRLAAAFWPGPLTLVLPKAAAVPEAVTAGLSTVAVRVPAHAVALALLRAAGVPVAAPSANPSTRVSPTTATHVARTLEAEVDLILDAGPASVGIESTVLDLSGAEPTLLRPGAVGREEIEAALGSPVSLAAAHPPENASAPRPSPGMLERHYAPRAALRLFPEGDAEACGRLARQASEAGLTTGALLRTPIEAPVDHPYPMPATHDGYARLLYAALHAMDDAGCDVILVEDVPGDGAWAAVRDRLRRAAHGS